MGVVQSKRLVQLSTNDQFPCEGLVLRTRTGYERVWVVGYSIDIRRNSHSPKFGFVPADTPEVEVRELVEQIKSLRAETPGQILMTSKILERIDNSALVFKGEMYFTKCHTKALRNARKKAAKAKKAADSEALQRIEDESDEFVGALISLHNDEINEFVNDDNARYEKGKPSAAQQKKA